MMSTVSLMVKVEDMVMDTRERMREFEIYLPVIVSYNTQGELHYVEFEGCERGRAKV